MRFPPSFPHCLVAAVTLGSSLSFAVATLSGNHGLLHHHEERASRVLEAAVVGTYLMECHTYDRDLQVNSHDRTANVELPDGRTYEVYNAPVGWEKGLRSGRDEVLIPEGTVIYSNGRMNVKGKKIIKKDREKNGFVRRNLIMGEDVVERTTEQELDLAALQSDRRLQQGTRTILAVRVIVNNGEYNHTNQAGLSDDVFGNGNDPVNLKSQYAACSYNQLVFDKAPDKNMLTTVTPNIGDTAISNGAVDIRVNHDKSAGGGTIRNAVTTEINRVFGVSKPNVLADHVMYCMPGEVINGSIAYAYMNSWNSVYSNKWCNFVSVQMHEGS